MKEATFAFVGDRLLVRRSEGATMLPTSPELIELLGSRQVSAATVPAPIRTPEGFAIALDLPSAMTPGEGFELVGLRELFGQLPEEAFRAAGTARQKVHWYRTHRFCSRCGADAARSDEHEAMECPSCGYLQFPRVAPAAIVLVQRGDEALLARSPRFPEGVYSTLAGFVEPGESLEECAHREIEEEVGVRIDNLRYFGSQPHPFPHSLMVGFVADWKSGDIEIDAVEIADAQWFTAATLPGLPHPMSIARELIEDFVRRTRR